MSTKKESLWRAETCLCPPSSNEGHKIYFHSLLDPSHRQIIVKRWHSIPQMKIDGKNIDLYETYSSCEKTILILKELKDIVKTSLSMLGNNVNTLYLKSENSKSISLYLKLVEGGCIKRIAKPLPWCISCKRFIQDEIISKKVRDVSCYVSFPVDESSSMKIFCQIPYVSHRVSFLVWTSSPWSIPFNRAIALHPKIKYSLLNCDDSILIVATSRIKHVGEDVLRKGDISSHILGEMTGEEIYLLSLNIVSLIIEDTFKVVLSDQVSETVGSGIILLVPGCSPTDYSIGKPYSIPVDSIINAEGNLCSNIKPQQLAGLTLENASASVLDILSKTSSLKRIIEIEHFLPHCSYCGTGLIFRTTNQWFLDLTKNGVLKNVIDTTQKSIFNPKRNQKLVISNYSEISEWCISNEGPGINVPAIVCSRCGYAISHSWCAVHPLIIPDDFSCPCCGEKSIENFVLETVVFNRNFELCASSFYLSGNSKKISSYIHVGDFLSHISSTLSILIGETLKSSQRTSGKISRLIYSVGRLNLEIPIEYLSYLGGDIFRIWIMRTNYTSDTITLNEKEWIKAEKDYFNIQNFYCHLLDLIKDMDHTEPKMNGLDLYILDMLHKTNIKVQRAYGSQDFNSVHLLVLQFISQFSEVFLPMILSTYPSRRIFLTVMETLIPILSPYIPFLAEEIFQSIHAQSRENYVKYTNSVREIKFLETKDKIPKEVKQRWESLEKLRNMVEKEKNRFNTSSDLNLIRVEVKLDIGSCRDSQAIFELFKEEKYLLTVLNKYFCVSDFYLEFIEHSDVQKSFGKNLKQSCKLIITINK